jgi:hypothetical protein
VVKKLQVFWTYYTVPIPAFSWLSTGAVHASASSEAGHNLPFEVQSCACFAAHASRPLSSDTFVHSPDLLRLNPTVLSYCKFRITLLLCLRLTSSSEANQLLHPAQILPGQLCSGLCASQETSTCMLRDCGIRRKPFDDLIRLSQPCFRGALRFQGDLAWCLTLGIEQHNFHINNHTSCGALLHTRISRREGNNAVMPPHFKEYIAQVQARRTPGKMNTTHAWARVQSHQSQVPSI